VVYLVLSLLHKVGELFEVGLQLKNFEELIIKVDFKFIHLKIKINYPKALK
jgi:hypothetical protein